MKKSILIVLTVFGINVVIAQTNTPVGADVNGVNPPATLTNKFRTDYPNINANWSMEGDNYSAQYTDPTTNMGKIIVYDRFGNIMHTDNEMTRDGYPSVIGDYYTKKYPNEDYKVWSSDDGKGNMTYYSKRDDGTLWFDKTGAYTGTKPGKGGQKNTKTTKPNPSDNKTKNTNNPNTNESERSKNPTDPTKSPK